MERSVLEEDGGGQPVCRGCGQEVADRDPALYEVLVDGTVAAVVLPEDEPFEVPPGAALVEILHPHCFKALVREWNEQGGGMWHGRCPLSGQTIVAQHPIDACPVCSAAMIAAAPG